MEQKTASANYLGTIKVSRGKVKDHIYPTLRLPEVLGAIIGKRVGVFAAGDHIIISPDKYNQNDKNLDWQDLETERAPCLYTAGIKRSNRFEPIVFRGFVMTIVFA